MRLGRNLLAGLASSVWTALVSLAVVPFYLKYLGIEAYGLIGFLVITQSLLQLLDLGLAPTINREIARYSAVGNIRASGSLLHTLSVIYWGMAGVIALVVVALAPLISRYWLRAENIPVATVNHAVMLMALIIAFRWPVGLYQGALMGAQRIVILSIVSSAVVTFGSLGAVGILAFVSPTVQALFFWHIGVAAVYVFVMRSMAWRVVGRTEGIRFDLDSLRQVWRFSAGMSVVTLSALVFTQLDKVILSKILSLPEFGHYMLATVVASGLYVLVTPFFNAVYPRISVLVANGETEKLADVYRLSTRLLGAVLFPIAMVLAIFSEDIVQMWIGDPDIARSVAPLITLLTIGSALHGVMHLPFALQLAYGMTRLPLIINGVLMVILAPLIVVLTFLYGGLGAAIAWLVLHVLYVMLGAWLTHRRLLIGMATKWLIQDVGIPLVISLLVVMAGFYAMIGWEPLILVKVVYLGGLASTSLLLSVAASSQLRAIAFIVVRRLWSITQARLFR